MSERDYPFVVKPVDPDEKDVRFIVQYLDFPGLSGGGDTIQEALLMAEEAKNMYLDLLKEENKPWPKPTDLSVNGRITLRLPKTLHLKAIDLAERENVSLNSFINDAIAQKVYSMEIYKNIQGIKAQIIDQGHHSQRQFAPELANSFYKDDSNFINFRSNCVSQKRGLSYGG